MFPPLLPHFKVSNSVDISPSFFSSQIKDLQPGRSALCWQNVQLCCIHQQGGLEIFCVMRSRSTLKHAASVPTGFPLIWWLCTFFFLISSLQTLKISYLRGRWKYIEAFFYLLWKLSWKSMVKCRSQQESVVCVCVSEWAVSQSCCCCCCRLLLERPMCTQADDELCWSVKADIQHARGSCSASCEDTRNEIRQWQIVVLLCAKSGLQINQDERCRVRMLGDGYGCDFLLFFNTHKDTLPQVAISSRIWEVFTSNPHVGIIYLADY